MPTVQDHNQSQPYPKLHHAVLDTTFCGINHLASTPHTSIHQYLGIKYASIPARFRQSKLFNTYPAITLASKNGCGSRFAHFSYTHILKQVVFIFIFSPRPICPQSRECKIIEEMLFGLDRADIPSQSLKHDEFECLNLNITCPAGLTLHSRLPVMVWIHGYVYTPFTLSAPGSYSPRGGDRGSGSSWVYDGGAVVRKSMEIGKPLILVSMK